MGRDLLARIEAVDWDAQRHAYGPATDVPALLQTLATADRRSRRRALAELAIRILHLGRCAPVTIEIVPFLVELATDPSVKGRGAILTLLGNLAKAGDIQVHAAVAAGLDDYVAALSDRASEVRAAAVYVLAHLPPNTVDAVRGCVADSDESVRATARLTLAALGHDAGPVPADSGALERFAAAAASAMLERATLADVRELVGALATRERQPVPWNDGDVASMALSLLELAPVGVLLAALTEIPDGDREHRLAVYDLAEVLLRIAPNHAPVGHALRARGDVWTASRIVRAARAAGVTPP
jgi:hypothetical protein